MVIDSSSWSFAKHEFSVTPNIQYTRLVLFPTFPVMVGVALLSFSMSSRLWFSASSEIVLFDDFCCVCGVVDIKGGSVVCFGYSVLSRLYIVPSGRLIMNSSVLLMRSICALSVFEFL